MSLIVYQLPHSPYCIPITAALRSLGEPFETKDIPNWDRTDIIRLTGGAYYQVPLLVHNRQAIHEMGADSQDVPRYVDENFAGGRLFPARLDGQQSIVIHHLEDEVESATFRLCDPHYVDSITDLVGRTMVIRHKERKFGRNCLEEWRRDAATIRAQADRLLRPYESTLQHSRFLFGDAPVYSDFLLYGILGNMTWNGWNTLSKEQPNLQRFVQTITQYRF